MKVSFAEELKGELPFLSKSIFLYYKKKISDLVKNHVHLELSTISGVLRCFMMFVGR